MARSRLAMMAVRENYRTPWITPTGQETAAMVKGLGEGDVVRLMVDLGDDVVYVISLKEGHNNLLLDPLPRSWKKYLVDKHTLSAGTATTVEVLLG